MTNDNEEQPQPHPTNHNHKLQEQKTEIHRNTPKHQNTEDEMKKQTQLTA